MSVLLKVKLQAGLSLRWPRGKHRRGRPQWFDWFAPHLRVSRRTAVGLDSSGTLLLLVVDGEEDIRAGADLDMMEDIMLGLGAEYAINLDGGGSSDAVYDGKIVSHPTCQDNKTECERDVCTVTCISTEPMQ